MSMDPNLHEGCEKGQDGGNFASLGLTRRELAVLVRSVIFFPLYIYDQLNATHSCIQAAVMRAADEKKCGSGTLAQQQAGRAKVHDDTAAARCCHPNALPHDLHILSTTRIFSSLSRLGSSRSPTSSRKPSLSRLLGGSHFSAYCLSDD